MFGNNCGCENGNSCLWIILILILICSCCGGRESRLGGNCGGCGVCCD